MKVNDLFYGGKYMTLTLTIINIAIMLLFIFGLFKLQQKHVSFSKRVFIALGVGIAFGLALQFIFGPTSEVMTSTIDWFAIVGSGYVKLLQMVVMPLVFISIVAAFTKLKLSKNIGKISALIIAILVGTTAISAAIGIGTTLVFDLEAVQIQAGDAETARGEEMEARLGEVESLTIPAQILSLIPANPFLDLTGARATSTIAVVIFAAFIGVAYLGVKRKEPEVAETFAKLINTLNTIT